MPQHLEHSGSSWKGQQIPHDDSFLDKIDPRVKVACGAGLALILAFCQNFPSLFVGIVIALLIAAIARLPVRRTLRRLLAMEIFMVCLLLLLPFTTPGSALFSIGGLVASQAGLLHALQILIKANAVVLILLSLLGTMSASVLGHALVYFKISEKLIHILLFMVRYIEVIGKEYRRMQQAMKARAFTLRFNRHTWRAIGYLVGMLLIHSLVRSERISDAMKCRGFTGKLYLIDDFVLRRSDKHFTVVMVCLGLLLIGLNYV